MDIIGDFAYVISPSMVLALVAVCASVFNEYCFGLDGAVLA
jgi:hypothetical protein